MKLLFDQNVSPKLVRNLADIFPDSNQVFHRDLDQADDNEICRIAFSEGFAVVTKDADYSEMLYIKNSLPKIIWIRKGNLERRHRVFASKTRGSNQLIGSERNCPNPYFILRQNEHRRTT